MVHFSISNNIHLSYFIIATWTIAIAYEQNNFKEALECSTRINCEAYDTLECLKNACKMFEKCLNANSKVKCKCHMDILTFSYVFFEIFPMLETTGYPKKIWALGM